MKITKKLRDQAATICAIAASTPDYTESYGLIDGFSIAAHNLAYAAWDAVDDELPKDWYRRSPAVDAEAEALLRSGWSPGDSL